MRAETIRSGKAHGPLAYPDGKVVGWCNTGPRASYGNLHNLVPAGEPPGKIGSILCFVVAAPGGGKEYAHDSFMLRVTSYAVMG